MEYKNEIDIKDEDLKEEDFSSEELESDDTDWKAKAQELKGIAKRRATQLSKAKAKLGEFETKVKELTPEPKPQDKTKSGDKLLERLDKMALQVAGIKEADEVELFNKWKEDTGREADAIVGNDIFKKEIENMRTAKANQAATSDIQGGGDKSGGAKDNPDYWIAKATKGKDGKLEFPEETPKDLYSKILEKMSDKEPSSSGNLKFYNE